jgi:hypothetical protein
MWRAIDHVHQTHERGLPNMTHEPAGQKKRSNLKRDLRKVGFMERFVENLVRKEQCEHASTFVQGLLSNLEHKNVESIAYPGLFMRG